ncbi:hypothetical protein AAHC03_01299 [Spirometra sp. Aus1]
MATKALKTSIKNLQINPETSVDLDQDRQVWKKHREACSSHSGSQTVIHSRVSESFSSAHLARGRRDIPCELNDGVAGYQNHHEVGGVI